MTVSLTHSLTGRACAGTLIAGLEMSTPLVAHASEAAQTLQSPIFDLGAAEPPILENIVRYAQWFFSIMLGTGYVMLRPFAALLKKPVTGVLVIGLAVGLFYFVQFTVNAMLGNTDPVDYVPGSFVTPKLDDLL